MRNNQRKAANRPDVITLKRNRNYRVIRSTHISGVPTQSIVPVANTDYKLVNYCTHPIEWVESGDMRGLGFFLIDDIIIAIAAVASAIASVIATVSAIIASITAIISAIIAQVAAVIGTIMEFVGLGELWAGITEIYSLGSSFIAEVNSMLIGGMDSLTGGLLSNLTAIVQMPSIPGLNIPGLDRLNIMDGLRFTAKIFDIPLSPEDLLVKYEKSAVRELPLGSAIIDAGDFVDDFSNHPTLSDALEAKANETATAQLNATIEDATGIPVSSYNDIQNAAEMLSDPAKAQAELEAASQATENFFQNADPARAASDAIQNATTIISEASLPSLSIPGVSLPALPTIETPSLPKTPDVSAAISKEVNVLEDKLKTGMANLKLEDVMNFLLQFLQPNETFSNASPATRARMQAALLAKWPMYDFSVLDWPSLDKLRYPKSDIMPIVIMGGAALLAASVLFSKEGMFE